MSDEMVQEPKSQEPKKAEAKPKKAEAKPKKAGKKFHVQLRHVPFQPKQAEVAADTPEEAFEAFCDLLQSRTGTPFEQEQARAFAAWLQDHGMADAQIVEVQ